jgi:hypothetical protein
MDEETAQSDDRQAKPVWAVHKSCPFSMGISAGLSHTSAAAPCDNLLRETNIAAANGYSDCFGPALTVAA